jgi:hypothetical protein
LSTHDGHLDLGGKRPFKQQGWLVCVLFLVFLFLFGTHTCAVCELVALCGLGLGCRLAGFFLEYFMPDTTLTCMFHLHSLLSDK